MVRLSGSFFDMAPPNDTVTYVNRITGNFTLDLHGERWAGIRPDWCPRYLTVRDPADREAVLALLNQSLRNRRDDIRFALPSPGPLRLPPPGDFSWTVAQPDLARPFLDPERGAPALVWRGQPYIFGNRADVLPFQGTATGSAFLSRLPKGAWSAPEAAPALRCPLPEVPPGG